MDPVISLPAEEMATRPRANGSLAVSAGLFAPVVSRLRLIAGVTLAVVVVVAAVVLLKPRTYTATASFIAQAPDAGRSELAGVAARFGVVVGGSRPGESTQFYADLITARPILQQAVLSAYHGDGGNAPADLIHLLDVGGATQAVRLEKAIARLGHGIGVQTSRETGVIQFRVTTPSARLSQEVAARLISLINDFNLSTRQSQAAAERRFVEGRLTQARTELFRAEDRMEDFLRTNRSYENSPQLLFEHERLQRDLGLRQQLYATLAQSYEQAKIDEIRNIPVLTVIQQPSIPAWPDSRRTLLKLGGALAVGLLLGVGLALLLELRGGAASGQAHAAHGLLTRLLRRQET